MAKIPTSRPMIFVPSAETGKTEVYSYETRVPPEDSELARLVQQLDPKSEIEVVEERHGMLRATISLGAYGLAVREELIAPQLRPDITASMAPQLRLTKPVPMKKIALMLGRIESRIRSSDAVVSSAPRPKPPSRRR